MTEFRQNLQEKINRILKGDTSIHIEESELIHPMYYDKIVWIKLSDLEYFEGNNQTIKGKVTGYLSNYQPDLFRPIEVCLIEGGNVRIEGDEYIIEGGRAIIANGHHRKSLFLAINMLRVPAYIRTDLKTLDEVRDYYVRLNTSLEKEKKDQLNIFGNAKLLPGTLDWIITNVAKKYGLEVDGVLTDYAMTCISTLRNIVEKKGEENLDMTFYVLTKAFYGDADSISRVMIKNISDNLHKHRHDIQDPVWMGEYISTLREMSSAELKKKWTPKSTENLARPDIQKLEAVVKCNSEKKKYRAQSN